ncbi:MAG: hypothetical protein MZW92_08625 [Comamonadaceae bacterium]|nr:hypothetical protein [Comamonadaceae bacterium]
MKIDHREKLCRLGRTIAFEARISALFPIQIVQPQSPGGKTVAFGIHHDDPGAFLGFQLIHQQIIDDERRQILNHKDLFKPICRRYSLRKISPGIVNQDIDLGREPISAPSQLS